MKRLGKSIYMYAYLCYVLDLACIASIVINFIEVMLPGIVMSITQRGYMIVVLPNFYNVCTDDHV